MLLQSNKSSAALPHLQRAIELNPEDHETWSNLGIAHLKVGRNQAAIESLGQALRIAPDDAVAHANLGAALLECSQTTEALSHIEQALKVQPNFVDAHVHRGHALHKMERLQESMASFQSALSLHPNNVDALCGLGNVHMTMSAFGQAASCFEQAHAHEPQNSGLLLNLANACVEINRVGEAIELLSRYIADQPSDPRGHYNLAVAYLKDNQVGQAIASFDETLRLDPYHHDALFSKSLALLVRGDYELGWPLYEKRWDNSQSKISAKKTNQHLWSGKQDLKGKTIFTYAEQGLGDTIQFSRYLPLLQATGARIVCEVQTPLLSLMSGSFGSNITWISGESLPAFDVHCPLMTLPLAFGTTTENIPWADSYLTADHTQRLSWQGFLGTKSKPRIGLVWAGSATHRNDHNRSIPAATLLSHLPDGFDYICLQKEIRPDELVLMSERGVLDCSDQLHDMSDTAALCAEMDLILSTDTSVAHLAGALGRPTWVLLPYCPDWRWLLHRTDSPWYASMRLFRQDSRRSWDALLPEVKSHLRRYNFIP